MNQVGAMEGSEVADDFETVCVSVPLFRIDRRLWAEVREGGLAEAALDGCADEFALSLGGLLNVLTRLEAAGFHFEVDMPIEPLNMARIKSAGKRSE